MLTRTGLLIILALAAMLVAGCGGVKYENTDSVLPGVSLEDCDIDLAGRIQVHRRLSLQSNR